MWLWLVLCFIVCGVLLWTWYMRPVKFEAAVFAVLKEREKWPQHVESVEFLHDCLLVRLPNNEQVFWNYNYVQVEKHRWQTQQAIYRPFEHGYFLLKDKCVFKYSSEEDPKEFNVVGRELQVSWNGRVFVVLQDSTAQIWYNQRWHSFPIDAAEVASVSKDGRYVAVSNAHTTTLIDMTERKTQNIPHLGEKHFIGFQDDMYFIDATCHNVVKYSMRKCT